MICCQFQGWKSYLGDLEKSGMIKSGIIANFDGGKSATSFEYVENHDEIDKLVDQLNDKQARIYMLSQVINYLPHCTVTGISLAHFLTIFLWPPWGRGANFGTVQLCKM